MGMRAGPGWRSHGGPDPIATSIPWRPRSHRSPLLWQPPSQGTLIRSRRLSHGGPDPIAAPIPSQPPSSMAALIPSHPPSHCTCTARSRGPLAPAPRAPAGPGDVAGADWRAHVVAWREAPPPRPSERGHGVRRPGGAHHRHERVLGGGRRRPALARTQGAEPRGYQHHAGDLCCLLLPVSLLRVPRLV
ncbi:hypothetical protein Nmel_013876 [Mimus melanotis]